MATLSVSEVARHYGVVPRIISDLFYLRRLPDDLAPVIRGHRRIPEAALPEIEAALERAGKLDAGTAQVMADAVSDVARELVGNGPIPTIQT